MRSSTQLLTAAAIFAAIVTPAASFAQRSDSAEVAPVLSEVLATIRGEVPFGRVLVDRVVADTTKRLAPPLMSGREHKLPEIWATPNRAEVVQTDLTYPVCRSGNVDCVLPDGVAATVAFSDAKIVGDSARVIARYSKNTGTGVGHVMTIVEAITLRRTDGDWKIVGRKIRASA